MRNNNTYIISNRDAISDFLLKDALYKGFPLHTPKARNVWEMLLNGLLESIDEEFGEVRIVKGIPPIIPTRFLEDFYDDRFERIAVRIPNFTNEMGVGMSVMTDALPSLFPQLDDDNVLFSTYTVVRPRTFGVKPFLRDEFIRYFQIVVSSEERNMDETLRKLDKAIHRFFDRVRISVIAVDRYSDSYYVKKSCLHAVWTNGNIESVLQCGILKKRHVTDSGTGKMVIEVGGTQRLLATFIYSNTDIHGLFLPHYFRNYDIIVRSEQPTKLLTMFEEHVCGMGGRLKYVSEDLSLRKTKRIAISESALAIVVKRIINNMEFMTVYNRDMTVVNLYSIRDIDDWMLQKYRIMEEKPFEQQQTQIKTRIKQGRLHFKCGEKSYPVIESGIFN